MRVEIRDQVKYFPPACSVIGVRRFFTEKQNRTPRLVVLLV